VADAINGGLGSGFTFTFRVRTVFIASAVAGERQHCRARAAPPRPGAVVAISRIVSTQWRKVDGRWQWPCGLFAERIYSILSRFAQA
jgi:hypothetical protein